MNNISFEKLTNVSLIDGRNRDKLLVLREYFSEFALYKYRIFIETEYLVFLSQNTDLLPALKKADIDLIREIHGSFNPQKCLKVKKIEAEINHDVKAVEIYISRILKSKGLGNIIPFVHFGLTSYDINIPSYGLILKDFRSDVLLTYLDRILSGLKELILDTKNSMMLGRTHGQAALPTTMGKEMSVFYLRLKKEIKLFRSLEIEGKLTGAVGNFNALAFAAPEYDWLKLSSKFIKKLGLIPNLVTTQILPYDNWIMLFDSVRRINSILVGLCQDIWTYISFDYFLQKNISAEVGSSTMAHKINPITFENAEGNLQMGNSMFEFFSRKLPVSRLQRDLSDSTVKRDFGTAFGFTLLAWDSLLSGFSRITPNNIKMSDDLDNHWEIFSEGIQTYLRRIGKPGAFDLVKKLTRAKTISKSEFFALIDKLPVSSEDKRKLKINNLSDYSGLVQEIIREALSS